MNALKAILIPPAMLGIAAGFVYGGVHYPYIVAGVMLLLTWGLLSSVIYDEFFKP